MNHLILSEKELSRNQFLDSTSKTGLYLLNPIIDENNLGDTIAFLQDNGLVNDHNIIIECQNHYTSLKQYMRYTILNEKLEHIVNGPSNYPLVRFKDSEGLNIWENFKSQNKYGGYFSISNTMNVDNGIIIIINNLKIINGGDLDSDKICLRYIGTTGTNIDFSIRFSKTGIKVINNYNNSQIGSTVLHDFSEEHSFLIAIKFDAGALKMGFHYYGNNETTYTLGFYDASLFLGSGGIPIIKFINGQTSSNHSCSISGIDFYISTGLNFVTFAPSPQNIYKLCLNYTLYDSIIDTKINTGLYTNFYDTIYTKKYDNDKLIICYLLFKSSFTQLPKIYFMVYDKLTDSFINKKDTIANMYMQYTSLTRTPYSNISNNYILKINVIGTRIFLSIHLVGSSNNYAINNVSHMYSDDLGLTWFNCCKDSGFPFNDFNTSAFQINLENPFENGFVIDSDFIIANDNKALLEATSYCLPYIEPYDIKIDGSGNYWLIGGNYWHSGTKLAKFDSSGNILGVWEHCTLKYCRTIQIIGNYIYAFGFVFDSCIVKIDINNPMNIVKKENFNISLFGIIGNVTFNGSVTDDGTYFYVGIIEGYLIKIDLNLNYISSYLVTLPISKSFTGIDHNSNDNSLWFTTQTPGYIYKISSTFTGETQYVLTGYSGQNYGGQSIKVWETGNYVFICDNNNTSGKVLRISTAGTVPISAALSVNNNNILDKIYVDGSYIFCITVNGFDRFSYPQLVAISSYTKPVNTNTLTMFYNTSINRMFVGLENTVPLTVSNFNFSNIVKVITTSLPPSLEASYKIYKQYRITIKSHTDINQNLKDFDKIYLKYNNGVPLQNDIRYGKFVASIDIYNLFTDNMLLTIGGLCILPIPSSNNFALIYHAYSGTQWNIYGQQIDFDGTNFTLNGAPIVLISNVGQDERYSSFHKIIDTDANYLYIFMSKNRTTSQKNYDTYVMSNTSLSPLGTWTNITTIINKPAYLNSLFVAFKSIEYFNNDLIRSFIFVNPNGYSEPLPYNFAILQSNIKYKKPSRYLVFVNDTSYVFSVKDVNSLFTGDNTFRMFKSYSPKTILDSNSINKTVDNIFSEMIDNILVKFGGSKMYDLDKIQILSDYQIKGDEIASISPSEIWKSEDDNVIHRIIFDATLNGNNSLKFVFNSFALLNTNFEHAKILACDDGDFNTPDFSFDLYSYIPNAGLITCGTVTKNYIKISSLTYPSLYKYIGNYILIKSGIASGNVYKIINSDGFGIYLNNDVQSDGLIVSDTFVIFSDRMFNVNTNFNSESSIVKYRYIAVEIPAQKTYEGYYIIGKLLIGLALKLKYARSIPYSDSFSSGIEINKSIGKQAYPIINHNEIFSTEIVWNKLKKDGVNELILFMKYIQINKHNFAFANDMSKLNDFKLVRLSDDFEYSHELGDDSIFTSSLSLIEEL